MNLSNRMPCLFVPHGGGPCFFMVGPPPFDKATWANMAKYLESIGSAISPRPKAVVVISAHWQAPLPTINTSTAYSLLFDYYGFPDHTYRLTYPATPAPEIADRVQTLLAGAGIAIGTDASRGLDHGVFVPFKLIYPDADIPLVQISLRDDMDPLAHMAMGRALAPLRDEDILIVGTGMSYHNISGLGRGGQANLDAEAFDTWLADAVLDPERRDAALMNWRSAPSAEACHPEPEHLMPLHVVAGAAGPDEGRRVFRDLVYGKPISAFQFGRR